MNCYAVHMPPSTLPRAAVRHQAKDTIRQPCDKEIEPPSQLNFAEAAVTDLILFHASKAVVQIQFTAPAGLYPAGCFLFVLFHSDDDFSVGFFALAVCRHIAVALQSRVDDPSLVGIHRLQSHAGSVFLDLAGNILCQIFKSLFAALTIVFRVSLDMNVSFHTLIYDK